MTVGDHRVEFLGPPASGKGTAAMALSAALQVPHVSTGQMFRAAIRKGGPLGDAAKQFIDKGQLVPDSITLAVVRLSLDEPRLAGGFIFDGFPRTRMQAEAFEAELMDRGTRLTAAILLDVNEANIRERVLGRLSCEKCGALYHKRFVRPRRSGICDRCGSRLTQRADDTLDTVQERLEVYRQVTLDAVAHYEGAGLLKRVDGGQSKDKVFADIVGLLQS